MKHIFDATFFYWPSFATDVRRTFERIRKEQQASAELQPVNVLQLDPSKNHRLCAPAAR